MNDALVTFFRAIAPYYRGEAALDAVTAALGPSPSPGSRMDFYARLMAANRRRILRQIHPLVHAVVASPERAGVPSLGTWDALVERYARSHPASGWDPNEFGRGFADWLRADDAPSGLAALADWGWQRLTTARAADEWQGELHASVVGAAYAFDLASWAQAFEAGGVVRPLSEERVHGHSTLLVTYRDRGGVTRVLRPMAPELAIIAEAAGDLADTGFAPRERDAIRARLVALGVLRRDAPPAEAHT